MKKWLNYYFGFTKREYNALLALMTILLLISLLPYYYEFYYSKANPINVQEEAALQKLMLVNEQQGNYYAKIRNKIEEDTDEKISLLFKFDPNNIDLLGWQKLGLSIKQAQSIINYRTKGGKFYKAEDLKKMYTITPQKYNQLAPYITIERLNKEYNKEIYPAHAPYVKKAFAIIEINTADTLALDEIKGIGPAFARRIAKYRDKLGGFYKKEQLMEVYGLDSLKFNEIKDQISVDANHITKININIAEFDELKNNPYLRYNQIKVILQYRKQHGKYKDLDDLKKVAILAPQNIQNLAPYLTF